MGFRFRKSFKIAPGVRLNLNKKSAGISFGGKGFRYSINSNGRKTASAGIPGTGLYYTKSSGGGGKKKSGKYQKASNNYNAPSNGTPPQGNYYPPAPPNRNNNYNNYNQPKKSHNTAAIIWLIIFFPVGLYLMWAKTNWNKKVKIAISSFFGVIFLIALISSFASDSSSLPASSSGITEIHCYEEEIRLDAADTMNDEETVEFHFRVQNGDAGDLLNSDFVPVFSDDDIATAEVYSIIDYSYEVWIKVKAKNPGTTTMHVETYDGTVKSKEITVEVIGESPTYSVDSDSTTERTTESTTKETTSKETTTEKETKATSRTVYITPSGSKYHYSRSCAGDNAIETTLDEVKDTYEPCKKCAQ